MTGNTLAAADGSLLFFVHSKWVTARLYDRVVKDEK